MLSIHDRINEIKYGAISIVSTCLTVIFVRDSVFSRNTIPLAVFILFSIIAIVSWYAFKILQKLNRLKELMQKNRLTPDERKELEAIADKYHIDTRDSSN